MSRSLRGLLAPRTGRVALPAPAWAAASAAGAGVREPAGQREVDIAVAAVEHNLTLHAQRSLDHQRGAHLGSDRIDRPHRAQLRPAGTDLRGSARRAPACPRARDFYRRRRWKPAGKQSGGTAGAPSAAERAPRPRRSCALIAFSEGQRTDYKAAEGSAAALARASAALAYSGGGTLLPRAGDVSG